MKEILKLVPNSSNEETELEISTDYEIGDYNYFNGTSSQRGYYLYATPCIRNTRTALNGQSYTTVTQALGKGCKLLLMPVSRRSKKAEEKAELLAKEKFDFVVKSVCVKYGLELADEEKGH